MHLTGGTGRAPSQSPLLTLSHARQPIRSHHRLQSTRRYTLSRTPFRRAFALRSKAVYICETPTPLLPSYSLYATSARLASVLAIPHRSEPEIFVSGDTCNAFRATNIGMFAVNRWSGDRLMLVRFRSAPVRIRTGACRATTPRARGSAGSSRQRRCSSPNLG